MRKIASIVPQLLAVEVALPFTLQLICNSLTRKPQEENLRIFLNQRGFPLKFTQFFTEGVPESQERLVGVQRSQMRCAPPIDQGCYKVVII